MSLTGQWRSSGPNDHELIKAKNNPDWKVMVSKRLHRIYYFNSKTAESVWEKPEDLIFTADDMEKLSTIMKEERDSLDKNKSIYNILNKKQQRTNSDDIFPTSRSIVLPNQYLSELIEEDQNSQTDYNNEEDREGCDFFPAGRSIVLPKDYSSELIEQVQNRLTEISNEEQRMGSDFFPRRSLPLPKHYSSELIEQDQNRLTDYSNKKQRMCSNFLPRRSLPLPKHYSLEPIEQVQNRLTEFNNEEQRVGSDFFPSRSITLPHYTSESIEDNATEPDEIPLASTIDVTSTTLDEIIKHKKKLKWQKRRLKKNREFSTKLNSKDKHIVEEFIRAETCLQRARKLSMTLNNPMRTNQIGNQNKNHDTSMEWEESTPIKPRKAPPNTNLGWFEGKFEKNKPPNLDSELAIVLDTNVLINSLNFIETLKDKPYSEFRAKFIVPYQVLAELDHLKTKTSHTFKSMTARKAINMLYDAIGKKHPRIIGQLNDRDTNSYEHMTSTRADDFIISCCVQYKNDGYNVVLFTCDKNLTTRALMNGIQSVSENDLKKMGNVTNSKNRRKKPRKKRNNRNRTSFGRTNSMEDLQNENYNFVSTTNNIEELQNENDSSMLQEEHKENLSGYIPDNSYSESGTGPYERSDFQEVQTESDNLEPDDNISDLDTDPYERSDFQEVQTESVDLEPDDNISDLDTDPYERSDFQEVQTESVDLEPDDNISDLDTGTKKHCKSHESGSRTSFGRTNSVEDLQNESDSYMSLSENEESLRCVNSDNSNNGNNIKNEEQNPPPRGTFCQPKIVPEFGLTLLDKLKRSLIFFLTSVLKIQQPKINKENNQISEDMTVVLNNCLCRMQLGWTEVLNQPLLEDDIISLRVLKNILLKPAEEISWDQKTVEDLMNAAAKLAESFLKCDQYELSATSFSLVLKECHDIKKRLVHEIEQLKFAVLEDKANYEVLLAEAAFHICWSELYCHDVPSVYNLNKSKGPEALDGYIDSLSHTFSQVTDMLNGIKGVLEENPKSLTLNNPSIKLVYDTLVGIIPESTPLEIPSTSDTPSEPYFSCDLSVHCILAYCSRHDKREALIQAKDKLCKFWYTISRCCDEYWGLI